MDNEALKDVSRILAGLTVIACIAVENLPNRDRQQLDRSIDAFAYLVYRKLECFCIGIGASCTR